MSDGAFITAAYGSDNDSTHNIRVQPETLTLTVDGVANDEVATPVDSELRAMVSRGRQSVGLNARLIRVEVTNGGTTDIEVGSILTLPWLDPDTFGDATRPAGKAVTYRDGITGIVSGNSPEKFRG